MMLINIDGLFLDVRPNVGKLFHPPVRNPVFIVISIDILLAIIVLVQESKGEGATLWGKLKSGAGWISLDFAKKL